MSLIAFLRFPQIRAQWIYICNTCGPLHCPSQKKKKKKKKKKIPWNLSGHALMMQIKTVVLVIIKRKMPVTEAPALALSYVHKSWLFRGWGLRYRFSFCICILYSFKLYFFSGGEWSKMPIALNLLKLSVYKSTKTWALFYWLYVDFH